uniref:Uncharacterized protein n=1 Tax=Rhizophora mucronata TaxID=61149 RepID=A0A2P2ITS5_RHIMU
MILSYWWSDLKSRFP